MSYCCTSHATQQLSRNTAWDCRKFIFRSPMLDNYFARYLPLLIHFLLAGPLASVMVLLSWIIGYRKPSRAKSSPYEYGMTPVGDARERFSVKFYMLRRKNGRAQYPGRKSCYCVTAASYSVRREPHSTARNDWDA